MGRLENVYEGHLLSSVVNEEDRNVLLRAAELQRRGNMQDALHEYEKLTASRSVPGVVIYKVRLMLMKGDFRNASASLEDMIDPKMDLASSPLNALIYLLKHYCDVFIHLKLQEAVDMARQVRQAWLEPLEIVGATDTYLLLEYYYQSIVTMKDLLQERLHIEFESPQALRERRGKLYIHLKSRGRCYEAFEVARMEMKFGVADLEQLEIFQSYLKLLETSIVTVGPDLSFPQAFFENKTPLSPAHVYLSIGKAYCKIGLAEEGLKNFNTALELFRGLESTNGQALANLQVALLKKASMTDPMGTCEELRNIANDLMRCEDWIGTNSALAELSEMLQCGPPSLQPQFRDCQLEIKDIYERTKNSLSFWHMQSQALMFEFTKPTSFGMGIEMCTAFFKDNPTCSIRLYKESFAAMLQIAYQGIGDEDRAIEYAQLCLGLTEEVGDRSLVIANEVALAGLQRKLWKTSVQPEEIYDRIVYLDKLFEEGSRKCNGKRIAEPHILVTLAVYLADLWLTRWDQSKIEESEREAYLPSAMRWIHQGQNILPDVQEDNKSSSRASLSFVQAAILQRMDKAEETVNLCSVLLFSHGSSLSDQDKANTQHLMATTLAAQCFKDPTRDNLEKAKDMYLQAIKTCTELGDVFMVAVCLKALVQMCSMWQRSTADITFDLSQLLRWIKQWEEVWEEILSQASVFRGLRGLQVRQRLREKNATTLYMTAIELCIEQDKITEAWMWTQRAKARAVAASLGLSRTVPSHLSQKLPDKSARLLEREEALLNEIETASEGWRYHLRMEHLELRRAMSTMSDLRPIQAIRQGGHLDVGEVDSMFGGDKNVVCIDWVELEGGAYHIIAVRPGETPRYFATNVSTKDVREWLDCYIFGEEGLQNLEDALPEDLEALEGLVSPLGQADVTTNKDLLVFVPTGLLCSVPLHALNLSRNGETHPIIERNPVAYSNALAILRQILVRSTAENLTQPEKPFQVAVFGDPTPDARAESKMVREVGELLKADMFIGEDATGKALLGALEKHHLIHYQGHAEFHSADILQNSVLKLYDQDVNLYRLFETPILQSPHISLVACQSGQQTLATGDEPLGFLTALTIAGAGSVLGTLWQLDDIYASSLFTKHFYQGLGTNIRTGKSAFIFELAVAHQKAVRAVREETKSLYRWAPFILYGSPWLLLNSHVPTPVTKQ